MEKQIRVNTHTSRSISSVSRTQSNRWAHPLQKKVIIGSTPNTMITVEEKSDKMEVGRWRKDQKFINKSMLHNRPEYTELLDHLIEVY